MYNPWSFDERTVTGELPYRPKSDKPTKRCRPSTEPDLIVLIPKDPERGPFRARVERAVRWLWSRGIYPGPYAVSLRLHGRTHRTLNGRETAIRNNMMVQLGITRQRKYKVDPARIDELNRKRI